jgi:AraC-like DNA-binding protein
MGAGMVPVERTELVTRDMEAIAALISALYVEHRARFRCDDPDRVDASVRSVTVNGLNAGLIRCTGVNYMAWAVPPAYLTAAVALRGSGTMNAGRQRLDFARGDALMYPAGLPLAADLRDAAMAAVQVPWPVVGALAEEHAGLPAADLRFEAMAPVSAARGAMWSGTAAFICHELVSSGITQVSPLMAQELTRLAAAALLETFPNTTMTTGYIPRPGQVPPAAVRRAAAYIDAHAGRPVTLDEIAVAAGVTGRALQYAFRRHYDMTPTGYLRRVRLERAYRELRDADPAGSVTVAAVARTWGWANPSQFTAAYRRQFGRLPGQTLRT